MMRLLWLLALLVPAMAAAQDHALPRGLGMNLTEVTDYQPNQPFIDRMKAARAWYGHLPGQWGGWDEGDLRAAGALGPNGWPRRVPDALDSIATLMMIDLPDNAGALAGDYRVRWDGTAKLTLRGRAENVRRRGPQELWFAYTPGPGGVELLLRDIDPDDPIRNIGVVHADDLQAAADGALFNPDWLARMDGMAVFRFVEWMRTNSTDQVRWADRPRPADYSYTPKGVPLEVMIRLANRTGTAPWVNIPHSATDGYIRAMARMLRDRLDPDLRAWIEFSNETWNWSFPQARHARDKAQARWGDGDAWQQWNAMRAAQMVQIFDAVFVDRPDWLVRVLATQTGWLGLEEQLRAPLWQAEDAANPAPPDLFDAYAITGYFSALLGNDEKVATTRAWLDEARARAAAEARARDLTGTARDAFIRQRSHAILRPRLIEELRDGRHSGDPRNTVARFLDETLPYHRRVADRWGLDLVAYEGGTHLVGVGPHKDDAALTALFIDVNYAPGMGALYDQLLDGWAAAGGGVFAHFSGVRAQSRWGSFGALRHLTDTNPRWDALMNFNASRAAR